MVSFANQINNRVPEECMEIWRKDNSRAKNSRLNEGNMVKNSSPRLITMFGDPRLGEKAYCEVRPFPSTPACIN